MFKFSKQSLNKLDQCHPDLKKLALNVINLELFDFGISCGYRGEDEQSLLYKQKKTQVMWPNSNHNKYPSHAMDIILYINGKVEWEDKFSWSMAIGVFRGVAAGLDIKIRVGADWDGDFSNTDQTFNDYPHIEIIT